MTITTEPTVDLEQQIEGFVGRLFGTAQATIDAETIYIGDRLGFYAALAGSEGLTSGELAARTGTTERYVREWLEQQAVTGILTVDDVNAGPLERRFSLPEAHRIVLLDTESLAYFGVIGRIAVGFARALPEVLEAFRTGEGVTWSAYGDDIVGAQADMNKAQYLNLLASDWFPKIPDLHRRLTDGPTRVADIGCGAGWSSIAIAKAYPKATVHGFDIDDASIALARRNAEEAGVADRVRFEVSDASEPAATHGYDLVTVFEALHDMTKPVDALRTIKRIVAEDGVVLIMDEAVADHFTVDSENPVEGFMYGASVLLCLPNGMVDHGAGTGTVMRPDTLRAYAAEAGFSTVDILPIEHMLFRFYRLG